MHSLFIHHTSAEFLLWDRPLRWSTAVETDTVPVSRSLEPSWETDSKHLSYGDRGQVENNLPMKYI